MRRLAAALALLFCACPEDPDEILVIEGTVTQSDAVTPLDGVKVELSRSTNGDCLTDEPWHELTTADGGQWRLQFFRGEVQPAYILTDTAGLSRRCVTARAEFASGASAEFVNGSFQPLTIGPLMFEWQPVIALEGGVVAFTPLLPPEQLAALDAHQTVFEDGVEHELQVKVGDKQIWLSSDLKLGFGSPDMPDMTPVSRVPINAPDYVLEDFDAELDLIARAQRKLVYPSTSVDTSRTIPAQVRHRPAVMPHVKGSRVPVTRGLDCGQLPPPCPLTDGKLETIFFDGGVNGFQFELGAPTQLSLLVLREAQFGIEYIAPQLDLMDDGGTLLGSVTAQNIATDDQSHFYLIDGLKTPQGPMLPTSRPITVWTIDGGVPASRVRVTFGEPVVQASELSLFAQ